MTKKKRLTIVEMVKEFQCPGCVNGVDPGECPRFDLYQTPAGSSCRNHCAGTNMLGLGRIALGMPKGFNRYGLYTNNGAARTMSEAVDGQMAIRLWDEAETPSWDRFNVPVWRLEQDGYLFARTFTPRINGSFVDVMKMTDRKPESTAEIVRDTERAYDAGKFFEEYD